MITSLVLWAIVLGSPQMVADYPVPPQGATVSAWIIAEQECKSYVLYFRSLGIRAWCAQEIQL